jgi:hypothetical protein
MNLIEKLLKRIGIEAFRPLLPIGIGASGGYEIANSVRLRASASAYFSRTPGTPTDGKKWTWSKWVKRGLLSSAQSFFVSTSGTDTTLFIESDNTIKFAYGGFLRRTTAAVFRDPTAHLHILMAFDSANAVEQDRAILYINGTRQTWATSTTVALNDTTAWNANAVVGNIGKNSTGLATGYFDGLLSDVHFIDGQALTPSSFGEENADGVWVPKVYAGTYGTNGFHIDFKDAAVTSGSNAGLGKDVSGNGNYWNTNSISVTAGVTYDALVDTPTNNYATLNPLAINNSNLPTGGNLNTIATAAYHGTPGSIAIPSGMKAYWEIVVGSDLLGGIGVCDAGLTATERDANPGTADSPTSVRWCRTQQSGIEYKLDGTTLTNNGAVNLWAAGEVWGVALDGAKLWIRNGAGTWINSGDPAAGTSAYISDVPTTKAIVAYINNYNSAWSINFGQRPFTYTPPTGFKALCTTNLPAVAITKPASAFKVTLATEDNIYADVATTRTGWSDYVDILKNRAASESWAWQFSHDSSNEYAISAASVTRQTKRTQSGSNAWVGYSIRIGATWGTAAGSASHTNGADTTVTHSVGLTARQMIFLFPRAGGSTVKVYHPDLASGKLLDLCSQAVETTDATIKTVTSTSFKIDTAMATGTYDYLVLSELSGFFALGKYIGNGDANGPFVHTGLRPKWLPWKRIDTASSWIVSDTARSVYNQPDHFLALQSTNSELGASSWGTNDIVSNGFKPRNVVANETNVSGGTYVFAALPEHPFGGSNVAPSPAR